MVTFNVVFANGKELSFKANEVGFYNSQTLLQTLSSIVGMDALNVKRYYYSGKSEIQTRVAKYLNDQFIVVHNSYGNNITEAQLKFFYKLCERSDSELYNIITQIESFPLTLTLLSDFV